MSSWGDQLKDSLRMRFDVTSDRLPPSKWICENTMLRSRPYSFARHEYQLAVVDDKHRIVAAKKCAQIGFSEALIRTAMCFLVQHPGCQAIMTQPTDKDMSTFAKSRVDTVWESSPVVARLGTGGVDSTMLKRVGTSFLNLRGTFGARAAISIPSDLNIYDEVNFSNPRVRNQYKSRLQHSEYKLERAISTPTIPGYGVSELYDQSDRKFVEHSCGCGWEGRTVWPDAIVIDRARLGYSGELDVDLMDDFIARPWNREVRIACTKCDRSLSRDWSDGSAQWVAEYPERARDLEVGVSGYQISQMDVPFVEPVDIVKASDGRFSEGYKRVEDFWNFVMGEERAGGDAQKVDIGVRARATLAGTREDRELPGCWIGSDLGNTCHVVALKDAYIDGELVPVVVSARLLPRSELEAGLPKAMQGHAARFTVSDAQPFTTTVEKIANAVGRDRMRICFFGGKKAFTLSPNNVQIIANRTMMLDSVTEGLSNLEVRVVENLEQADLFWKHCYNLVKVKAEDDDGEVYYEYVKVSTGEDHFGLALGYALLARRVWYETVGGKASGAMPGITGVRTNL